MKTNVYSVTLLVLLLGIALGSSYFMYITVPNRDVFFLFVIFALLVTNYLSGHFMCKHVFKMSQKDKGMSIEKCFKVIKLYKDHLYIRGVDPISANYTERGFTLGNGPIIALNHLLTMLIRMEGYLEEGRREKFMRWLGFVQGSLWVLGCFSLNELRSHLKPEDEPFVESSKE